MLAGWWDEFGVGALVVLQFLVLWNIEVVASYIEMSIISILQDWCSYE
jgi:hypothetical protein